MTPAKTRNRGGKKSQIENYYKVLGTRSNATADTIKKKYIEQVKQFPPEKHPEQFQQIRKAYEILRDPNRRAEYDLLRKHGGNLEAMLDEAFGLVEQSEWEQAAALYNQILQINPQSLPALLGMGHCALYTTTQLSLDEYFNKACEVSKSEEERMHIRISQARWLYEHEESLEALAILEQIRSTYPHIVPRIIQLYCAVYQDLDRAEEAWSLMYLHIPTEDEQEAGDLGIFINWMNLLIELDKWSLLSKVQQRIKKFLRTLSDEDDKETAISDLMEEYEEYCRAALFREALIFAEFAQYIDPKNEHIKQEMKKAKELAAVYKDMERMSQDENLFPAISLHAIGWMYEEQSNGNSDELYDQLPNEMLDLFEMDVEGYISGMNRLKKRYPATYRYFRAQWDELYEKYASQLNREQRRRLR